MRLTYKYEKYNGYGSVKLKNLPPDPLVDKWICLDNAWQEERNKLGKLEDIEEELGIDLITLFKALKNGIAIKDEPLQNYPCSLNHNDIGWLLFVRTNGVLGAYYLKDYGKTWALTKEELK